MVKAEVPQTYFATRELDLTSAIQRKNLVEILSSFPDSPLTPGAGANFAPNFPNVHSFQNQYGNGGVGGNNGGGGNRAMPTNLAEIASRMQSLPLSPANLHRLHAMHHQNNQNTVMNLQPMPSYPSGRSSVSPRSAGTNTSGYLSNIDNLNFSSSSNSLDQMYPPYKPNMHSDANHHFPQSENQTFANGSNGNGMNLSCRLNEIAGNHSFGDDNRLLTPNFALSVSYNNSFFDFFVFFFSLS